VRNVLSSVLALGLLAGLVGFGIYFFSFGQTYEGEIRLSAQNDEPEAIGMVTFQSRFRNRRFLTHSMFLDLYPETPTTFQGEAILTEEAVKLFADADIDARVGYREEKSGWGYVVSLDLEPPGASPKETLLVISLLLIFGCTAGMAVVAKID
jgi:hypothetical protein